MKPHPSIFRAALDLLDVPAADALMVGDSVSQDVEGALAVGMRAALLHRSGEPHPRAQELAAANVPVVASLTELCRLVTPVLSRP
jgi:putative hydrolase of the HAD superfamily